MTVLQTIKKTYIKGFYPWLPNHYPKRALTHWRVCERNSHMRKPTPREWIDPKSGKTYFRVRSSDSTGKVVQRVFSDLKDAEKYCTELQRSRDLHGRASAVGSDEIDALRIWREFVSKEHTGGRDAPALRDVIRTSIERLKDGSTTPALEALHKNFMDAKEREAVSPQHLAALKNRLKRFVSYFDKDEPAGSVTTEGVEKAMASMRAGGMSGQTVKGVRAAAHGLFQWALDRGLISSNPVTRAKAPKVKQGEVGTITASQLRNLLHTALSVAPRSVPALAVWAFCGVRRAELTRMRFEDLDIERKELRVSAKAAKTGVARFVPIPDALLAWLEAAKTAGVASIGKLVLGGTTKGPEGQIIPEDSEAKSEGQLNRWLREIRPLSGILEWPSNALRHSFASHAAAAHEDFAKVAAWLGHARDPRLLVARYRHAVAKGEGNAWFEVLPTGPPMSQDLSRKSTRQKTA
jgi:site-specific recombinase XerD